MKSTALRFLACPGCKGDLQLHEQERQGAEVTEGTLACPRCRREYAIARGVPRFVEQADYASSFGYQWNRFREIQLDSRNGTQESEHTLYATTGWSERDYRDRLVLDAGVGAGRFAEVVANMNCEAVGIDLTTSVDAAYENIGERENVHLVQADIFAMPFRDGSFDLAYSIGVLHHTPEPRVAFERVAAAVRKGGGLAVYVYHGYGLENRSSDLIRKLTTRIPLKAMFALSALAVPLYYVYRMPGLGRILQLLCPISLHQNWAWRWLDTFDWYTPKYQWKFQYPEIFRWFRASGFRDIEIFDDHIRMRGVRMETMESSNVHFPAGMNASVRS